MRRAPVDAAATPRFAEIATFLRLPRVAPEDGVEIGLVGAPFDLGVNHRSGPREAPGAVRNASRVIRRVHPTSGIDPYTLASVADIGDAPVNPLDRQGSLDAMEAFYRRLHGLGIRPITVGGDHTVPIPILRALAADRPVGVLQIDSHTDTFDELFGVKDNHATFQRRAVEEGLVDPRRVVQLGLRGSRFSAADLDYSRDVGFTVITMDDYEEMGRAAAIARIRETLGDGPAYVTIDIDGLDPSFCPGTPVPEIGGLTPRDVQVMIRSLRGLDLVGADICEVAPCYDPTGVTALTAANFMFELLCVMAEGKAG